MIFVKKKKKIHQNPIKTDVSHSTSNQRHCGIEFESMGQMTWKLLIKTRPHAKRMGWIRGEI